MPKFTEHVPVVPEPTYTLSELSRRQVQIIHSVLYLLSDPDADQINRVLNDHDFRAEHLVVTWKNNRLDICDQG